MAAKKKQSKSPQEIARKNYEVLQRGKVILRVQMCPSDDEKLWERIRDGLVKKYGSAKAGILALAKSDGIIEE